MNDELSTDTHRKFIEQKQASKFLFDPKDKIYDVLNEIHKKSFKVSGFRTNGSKLKGTDEYVKANNEMQDSLSWIINEVDELDLKMLKYLNFHK